jgi:hypothetical protein
MNTPLKVESYKTAEGSPGTYMSSLTPSSLPSESSEANIAGEVKVAPAPYNTQEPSSVASETIDTEFSPFTQEPSSEATATVDSEANIASEVKVAPAPSVEVSPYTQEPSSEASESTLSPSEIELELQSSSTDVAVPETSSYQNLSTPVLSGETSPVIPSSEAVGPETSSYQNLSSLPELIPKDTPESPEESTTQEETTQSSYADSVLSESTKLCDKWERAKKKWAGYTENEKENKKNDVIEQWHNLIKVAGDKEQYAKHHRLFNRLNKTFHKMIHALNDVKSPIYTRKHKVAEPHRKTKTSRPKQKTI